MRSGRARELCRARPEGDRSSSDLQDSGARAIHNQEVPRCQHTFPCSGSLRRAWSQSRTAQKRLDAAQERFRKGGGELKAFYLVTGQYDAVAISDAPDDATVAKLALGNASIGVVRTETLRAFTEDEYRQIVGSLS